MPLGLTVTDLVKHYEGNAILDKLSFTFAAGKTHVLMGANGCGKSTLLRICALLDQPDAGSLTFLSNGESLSIDLALQRRITLVLPKVGVFNDSVFHNVEYGLKIRNITKHERTERVGKMLEFIGLTNKRNQNALTLSSGETHRLGIGRALVIEPDFLFLDEPTTSIDQKNIELIEQIILTMKEAGKPTILMTTHDVQQAERLTDKVLTMREGKIESD